VTTKPGEGVICYSISVSNIGPATAAHIHEASAGQPGPVFVGLAPPTHGSSDGCAAADRDLIKEDPQGPVGLLRERA
jgi:hypothetical protein